MHGATVRIAACRRKKRNETDPSPDPVSNRSLLLFLFGRMQAHIMCYLVLFEFNKGQCWDKHSRVNLRGGECERRHFQDDTERSPASAAQCKEEIRVLARVREYMVPTWRHDLIFKLTTRKSGMEPLHVMRRTTLSAARPYTLERILYIADDDGFSNKMLNMKRTCDLRPEDTRPRRRPIDRHRSVSLNFEHRQSR